MGKNSETTSESREAAFSRKVGALEARKLKAKRRGVQGIWFGLGMFGLIGWAVAIPALLGVLLGVSSISTIREFIPGLYRCSLSACSSGV